MGNQRSNCSSLAGTKILSFENWKNYTNGDPMPRPRPKVKLPGTDLLVLDIPGRPRPAKAKAPKTRTGCKECKRRRIKCDEGRPSCQKCTSSGRACDLPLGPLAPIPTKQLSTPERSDLRILIKPDYTLSIFKTQQDWDLFHAFIYDNNQSGTLPINTLSALCPQIGHQDPAVREVCCAVAAAAAAFNNPSSDPVSDEKLYKVSLHYYSRALQAIRDSKITSSAMLSAAVVAMLFVTYDMMRGDMATAQVHFNYGSRISQSYFDERCKETGLPLSQIRFSTLESAVYDNFQRMTTYPWALELGLSGSKIERQGQKQCRAISRRYDLDDMPLFFHDVAQSLTWWDATQHHLVHLMKGAPSQGSAPHQQRRPIWEQSLAYLQRWHNSFTPLLHSARKTQAENPHLYIGACVFEALYLETLASLHLQQYPESNVLPDAKALYWDIVRTTREMQRQWSKANGPAALDNAIMRPLTFVLYKCHDEDIRQEVRDMLEGVGEVSQMAMPLLQMMTIGKDDKMPPKLRNVERALGWYLPHAGATPGYQPFGMIGNELNFLVEKNGSIDGVSLG